MSSVWFMQALNNFFEFDMPLFPNLVKLVIGHGWSYLGNFLNNMPNLEHITFLDVSLCLLSDITFYMVTPSILFHFDFKGVRICFLILLLRFKTQYLIIATYRLCFSVWNMDTQILLII